MKMTNNIDSEQWLPKRNIRISMGRKLIMFAKNELIKRKVNYCGVMLEK